MVLLSAVLSNQLLASNTLGYNIEVPKKLMTADKVNTRLGELDFFDGMPSEKTVKKVYDNLDFIRGVDVFLNFTPAASIEAIRLGLASIGADDYNKVIVFDKLMDSTPLFLTGNTDTVYATSIIDLEHSGPMVVEIPKGAGPGTINDAFFRFVVDMGAPGPDRKKGGIYIILPPDYRGELKPTPNSFKDNHSVKAKIAGETRDVWIAQSRSYINWVILRGFLKDGKPDSASEMWRTKLKIYPLKDANNPKKMAFINGSQKEFNTIHANNFEFYKELDHVIQKEPLSFIGAELRGQAGAIGIIKGKKFNPDKRMKDILVDSVAVGNATSRAILMRPRDKRVYFFEDRQWGTGFIADDYRWLDGTGMRGRNMDARTLFFYMATVNTPAMALKVSGVGSNYGYCVTDKDKNYLDGGKNYSITIPANVPAKDFWSIVIYDPQTRSELQTSQRFPSKNNKRDNLIYNKDGSVTLYYGSTAPKGKEANWTQTVPNKAWFAQLRLYGPTEAWFEKTWKPGDFELVK